MNPRPAEVSSRSADGLVRHVASTEPDTVALAEVLALAARVDPALLRAARRRFVPHRGPDLEADLWHSPLVSGANHTGLVFDQEVAQQLLLRLARDQERLAAARLVVEQEHRSPSDSPPGWVPDTLVLEEELRYLTLVPDGHRRIRRLLRKVAGHVEASGAAGLRSWLVGLDSRLPESLRGVATAVPHDGTGGDGGDDGTDGGGGPGEVVGVRLLDGALEIRATPYGAMHRLLLPDATPRAVFVDGRLVALGALPHIEPLDDPRGVTVQAHDGSSITLRRRRRQLTPPRPRTIPAHNGGTWGCAFSPDGTLLATTSEDRTVRLWDPATGAAVHTLTGHGAAVTACAFSPDGGRLASAGDDGTVRIWDARAGVLVRTLTVARRGQIKACAFSPDGALLATGGSDRTVRLWDTTTWEEQRALTGHEGTVLACAFSPDGKVLASTGNDRTVRLWRPRTGTLLHRLSGYYASVEGAAFSPDGSLLAVAGADRTVRLWDPATGAEVRTLPGHASSVWACAFSSDGSLLASASNDGTARLWDPTTGAELHAFRGGAGRMHGCALSPDGTLLATTGDDQAVHLWDATVAPPVQELRGHTSWVYDCAYAPDGSFLATAGADDEVRLWDPPTGTVLQVLRGHTNSIESCVVSPDGKRIATTSADHSAAVWETATGTQLHVLGPGGPTGDGGDDVDVGDVDATDVDAGDRADGHVDRVHAGAFSPDGTLLATVGADGQVLLWNPANGDLVDRLAGHRGSVEDCAFSPDGKLLATAGADQTVRLWDPRTGEPGRILTGHIRGVLACTFAADGSWLASTGNDQSVRLWDPASGEPLGTLRGHVSRVHACASSPDGSLLATASADRTVRLWDPAGLDELDRFDGPDSMLSCVFSPDGTALVATSADHTVTVWNLLTRQVARKGDTVALWLCGREGDAAAIAGAVAARPLTAGCAPVVALGGGAVPGVLLAAGVDPPRVEELVVATDPGAAVPPPQQLAGVPGARLLSRFRDPLARLRRALAEAGATRCGDLRVPVDERRAQPDQRIQRHRFQAVLVDVATDEVVVLPRDADRLRLGIDADDLPLAELALAAAGERDVTFGDRRFASAVGRAFDPGPWFGALPVRRPVFAVDVEDARGTVPARRFPPRLRVTTVTVPWLHRVAGERPTRRHRTVLARIGAQSLRAAVTDEPVAPARRRPSRG